MSRRHEIGVGDEVAFQLGRERRHATVIEDRGPLGVGGKRVMRLALTGEDASEDAVEFELVEDLLEIVARAKKRDRATSRTSS